jgi:hypothetical protein
MSGTARRSAKERGEQIMATKSLVTDVYISKAEALDVLATALAVEWILDDPADVTLPLDHGGVLSIDVPHYGEDLPLTLECHHADPAQLELVIASLQARLLDTLGWTTTPIE